MRSANPPFMGGGPQGQYPEASAGVIVNRICLGILTTATRILVVVRLPTTAGLPSVPRRPSSRWPTLLPSTRRSKLPTPADGNGRDERWIPCPTTSSIIRRTGYRGRRTRSEWITHANANATGTSTITFPGRTTSRRTVHGGSSGRGQWTSTDDQPGEDEDDGHVNRASD